MAVEYELKYRANAEVLERIQADFPGEYTVTEMTTTYYDTPGGDLAKLFWTLRHRREGNEHICTLKTPAGIDGRSEYEWHCEDIHEAIPHLSRLTGSNALNQLVERGLVETCGARFTRTARMFRAGATMAELAMDQGVLTNAGKEEPFAELEIELKRGYREEVQVMGFLLAEAYELEPETKSKYQRSRELGAKK
jgi:inorganic triphosphatase YgiF